MKVCEICELKTPTQLQILEIITTLMPELTDSLKQNISSFVQGDLKKLSTIYNLYKSDNNIINNDIMSTIFLKKSHNDDSKNITKNLFNNDYLIEQHPVIMNETDRTIIGLLWHENIVNVIDKTDKNKSIPFYLEALNNMCIADYIDRITFQKQIWQFNEMSSLIKTFKNNKKYHKCFPNAKDNLTEIRFKKVLNKYSTEYNNSLFIQNLCQQLNMDKKDMFAFFMSLKNTYTDNEILLLFENYDITKLDINRIYRYLDKYTKEDVIDVEENNNDLDEHDYECEMGITNDENK